MSDRGTCFTSKECSEFVQHSGCIHKTTTAYHPSSNGAIERVNRTLKAQLAGENWMDVLPTVLLGLRSVIWEDLGSTASEMVYGMNLHLPSQFFDFQSMPSLVMLNDRHYTVSVDRIKAAFLLEDYLTSRVNLNCLPITSASPDLHRLGKRNVQRPAYLNDYYC